MVLKLSNKSKNFYTHMGKIFGSREVERVTHDRFYDDDNKKWYIYYHRNTPAAFISVANNVIKNIWGEKDEYILATLIKIKSEVNIYESTVTTAFNHLYERAGYVITDEYTKNFVKVRGEKIEKD